MGPFSKISPKIVKMGLFQEKYPQKGYLFGQKWVLKMGRDFEAWVAHPPTKPNLNTPKLSICLKKHVLFSGHLVLNEMWEF